VTIPIWTKADEFGDAQIDAEHRRLLDLLARLEANLFVESEMDEISIQFVVSDLKHHIGNHFAHEEQLMTSLSTMSDLEKERHRANHSYWRARISEHLTALDGTKTDLERRRQLARLLGVAKTFWENHFSTFDRTLGQFLEKN